MTRFEQLQAHLRENGVKLTDQRKELLEVLLQTHAPITAEDLFLKLKVIHPTTCLATVYRNLEVLVANDIVRQMRLSGNKREYELAGDEHYHYLICLCCNKAVRLENCPLHHYEEEVIAETDFTITEHRFSMYGYCPQCKAQSQTK